MTNAPSSAAPAPTLPEQLPEPPGLRAKSPRWRSEVGWIWFGAVVLAAVKWWPLLMGGGIVGGDTYTYFFPLKAWYAERLRQGELAFWNPRIGNGAPILGESQTGVFYPLNLLFYGLLPLNAAYNASFIVHYVLAFGFTGLYLRRLGLRLGVALFGAVVFVYGWFPPRNCLEWAIVTGAWMPLMMWCIEGYLQEHRWRYCAAAAVALGVQLLAGHFNLAFITLVTGVIYAPLRGFSLGREPIRLWRSMLGLAASVGLGLGIAAIQLVPSWELKGRSQRHDPSFRAQGLSYGNVPAWYLPQVVIPWVFYPNVDSDDLRNGFGAAYTNKVEAHLYFGLLPLLLSAISLLCGQRHRILWIWLLLTGLSLVMVTGCWTGLLGSLPGFGYFTGPGRYGIVAQLGVAVMAAWGLQELIARLGSPLLRLGFAAVAIVCTWLDLGWAASSVQYAGFVSTPPVNLLNRSPVARILRPTDRVVSKFENAITLCGVAMFKVYLGIGPAEYYQAPTKFPEEFRWEGPLTDPVVDWMRRGGVTHVLAFEPHPDWPCDLVWAGVDPMLHFMLARDASEAFWLYRLRDSLGRAYWLPAEQPAAGQGNPEMGSTQATSIEDVAVAANRVEVQLDFPVAGRVVLTDLAYPGWRVEVDGKISEQETYGQMFRSVKVESGQHLIVWTYRPMSLMWGGVVSVLSWTVVILMGVIARLRIQAAASAQKTPPFALGETAGPEQRRGRC